MTTLEHDFAPAESIGALQILVLPHPQGCRTYVLVDPVSEQAMAVDVHLDFVEAVAARVRDAGWSLRYVIDTHTHADHPSGAGALAAATSTTRVAHELARHAGVDRHPEDGEALHLGDVAVTVRHAPGHTPDHIVLVAAGVVLSGDTLFIGGVARTDFLGGDAGELFDSLHRVFDPLPDETVVFPGHDYEGRQRTTLGEERRSNAWFRMTDRAAFASALAEAPPPRPANMDDLLRLNREGVDIPGTIDAGDCARLVEDGGSSSVIDVRTGGEFAAEHIAGSRLIPLDQLGSRVDEVRATPAPRLLMCRSGQRAQMAQRLLAEQQVGGLRVVVGGIEAYRAVGGETIAGRGVISLERQVRIGAGVLVLLGVILGTWLHPAFYGLAAFVGAGLTFAGITDWCGMGLLLAKAPWNRGEAQGPPRVAGVPSACAASAPAGCAASAPAGAAER